MNEMDKKRDLSEEMLSKVAGGEDHPGVCGWIYEFKCENPECHYERRYRFDRHGITPPECPQCHQMTLTEHSAWGEFT